MTVNAVIFLVFVWNCESVGRSVLSDSLQPREHKLASFFCPWNSPGENTGVGFHSLPQGCFQPKV